MQQLLGGDTTVITDISFIQEIVLQPLLCKNGPSL